MCRSPRVGTGGETTGTGAIHPVDSGHRDDEFAPGVSGLGLLQSCQGLIEWINVCQDEADPTGADVAYQLGHVFVGVGTHLELFHADGALGWAGVSRHCDYPT